MGRRTLTPISPDIDWEPYLLTHEDLPQPWSQESLFECEQPLVVELGSGKGLFMERASGATPDWNFLGLEVAYKYARFSAARLAKHQRSNAKMVHGDGLRVFREWIPDHALEEIHVYFPDPWWKARHRKRRVLRPEFLDDVQRTLRPGGTLHFWTDVQEYFESTLQIIEPTSLIGPLDVPETPAAHNMDFRTHFERRTRMHDEPVYRAEFRTPS